jgi:hypothetical protein
VPVRGVRARPFDVSGYYPSNRRRHSKRQKHSEPSCECIANAYMLSRGPHTTESEERR